MGKPHIEAYKRFQKRYFELSEQAGKEQYLVPYLMSSHPGSTLRDAVELAVFLKKEGLRPAGTGRPTPGTISTCMYHTGLDPYTMQPVYVPQISGGQSKAARPAAILSARKPGKSARRAAGSRPGRPDWQRETLFGSRRPRPAKPAAAISALSRNGAGKKGRGRKDSRSRNKGGHKWEPRR